MKHILGLDIGGTNIKGGVVTASGKVMKTVSLPTQAKRGDDYFFKTICRCIDLLDPKNRAALGVGCPGPLDPKRGIILSPPNVPLKNFPLRAYLARRYRLPTAVDNDANAFTLAEAVFGAGKKYRSVVGLTLGTGVGGGIVINKMIEHGRGNAGELGYVSLSMRGPRGKRGDIGSLQEYLRGKPMQAVKNKLGLHNYATKDLQALARRRKRTAREYWKRFGGYLGIGLTSIIHALDPDVIVLGGQISKALPYFRMTMEDALRKRAIIAPPPIRRAKLGNHAGIIGAALLTRHLGN